MNTKLRFMKVGAMLVLLISIFLFSCTKEETIIVPESELNSELSLKNGAMLPPEEIACDLLAGQSINVGKVIYSHDATNLYVTYLVNNPWVLTEIHFYAGTLAGLPINKTAIQIGHFPYDMDDFTGNQLIIPLADLSSDNGVLTLAAHAVVVNGDQNETAWADCNYKPVIGAKARFVDNKYALTDGPISYSSYFGNASTHWCSRLGLNIYTNGDGYLLQSRHYPLADAGTVEVSDDGTNLKVKIKGTVAGNTMKESYLFVGSFNQLGAIAIAVDGCPVYANFPFVKSLLNDTHEYIIPIPIKSQSFNSAFGSNRWGWITSYEL